MHNFCKTLRTHVRIIAVHIPTMSIKAQASRKYGAKGSTVVDFVQRRVLFCFLRGFLIFRSASE